MLVSEVLTNGQRAVGGVVVEAHGETLVFRTFNNTGLLHVACAERGVEVLRALCIHQVIILRHSVLIHGFLPVGVRQDCSRLYAGRRPVSPGIEIALLVIIHELFAPHHLDCFGHL